MVRWLRRSVKGFSPGENTVRETVLSFNTGVGGGKKMTNSHRLIVYEREPWQTAFSLHTFFFLLDAGCRMQDSRIVYGLSSFMVREMDYTSLTVSPLPLSWK